MNNDKNKVKNVKEFMSKTASMDKEGESEDKMSDILKNPVLAGALLGGGGMSLAGMLRGADSSDLWPYTLGGALSGGIGGAAYNKWSGSGGVDEDPTDMNRWVRGAGGVTGAILGALAGGGLGRGGTGVLNRAAKISLLSKYSQGIGDIANSLPIIGALFGGGAGARLGSIDIPNFLREKN